MAFLKTPFAHEVMMAQGGFLTPAQRRQPSTPTRPPVEAGGQGENPAGCHPPSVSDASDLMAGRRSARATF